MLRRFIASSTPLAPLHYNSHSLIIVPWSSISAGTLFSSLTTPLAMLHTSSGNYSCNSDTTTTNNSSNNNNNNSTAPRKRKIQVAVVGSGPSGCFVANTLTRRHPSIHVDVFERLPVPFGLSRYGVAPDHAEVKTVEQQFMKMFNSGNVSWIGNVQVGKDIPLQLLQEHYAAVVFATGAEASNLLSIDNEHLANVINARDLVHYYNTMPFPLASPRFCPFDVDDRVQRVVVIGNGNVAIDTARVLSSTYQYFAPTDMNCEAIKAFMKNKINQIDIVARRGPAFSAFTIAEFRELTRFQSERVAVSVDHFSLTDVLNTPCPRALENPRAYKRIMELVHKFSVSSEEMERDRQVIETDQNGIPIPPQTSPSSPSFPSLETPTTNNNNSNNNNTNTERRSEEPLPMQSMSPLLNQRGPCRIRFRYHLKPIKFIPNPLRRNYVGAVLFEYNTAAAASSSEEEQSHKRYCAIPCDLVIKAIGFHAESLPALPFEHSVSGAIANTRGRLNGFDRVYCAGWAKNGGKGVIVHTMADAQEVAATILEDIHEMETNLYNNNNHNNNTDCNNNVKTEKQEEEEQQQQKQRKEEEEKMSNQESPLTGDSAEAAVLHHNTKATHTASTSSPTMYGKYGLLDYLVEKKLLPISIHGASRIFNVEQERGVDLGKRLEKVSSVRDMLDIALGGELGVETERRVRGFAPIRTPQEKLIQQLLDPDEEVDEVAQSIAKRVKALLSPSQSNNNSNNNNTTSSSTTTTTTTTTTKRVTSEPSEEEDVMTTNNAATNTTNNADDSNKN